MAVFLKYYGIDPLDLSYGRFFALYSAINRVEKELSPKDPMEIARQVAQKTALIEKGFTDV